MTIGRFFRDVICAPYSIPIGLINYNVQTLGICSETVKKELDIKESTEHDVLYSGSVGNVRPDLSSLSEYSVLNQAIQNILTKASNRSSKSAVANTTFNRRCSPILPLEEDPDASYTVDLQENKTEKRIGTDGKLYELQTFGCCPVVEQTTNITFITFDNISEEDYENIYNEIDLHVENKLSETGSSNPSSSRMSVLSKMDIKNILKQNIKSQIDNVSNQVVEVSMEIDYTDRYQRCEYDFDENGYLMVDKTNCNNGLCSGNPKVIKQIIEIEALSKNIINTSMGLVMENINKVDSKTDVTVNRITNYRVIVVSLLWNIIVIFILMKLFGMFLRRIN
jgi:hypothetical protein